MSDPEVCPYCQRRPTGAGQDVYSDDHIFPESMGGKKTIRAGKSCNDKFGHTFEAQNVEETIIPLSMMLGRAGVPIALQNVKWKNAIKTPDGQVYNLSLTGKGLQPESAKPLVKRDPDDPKLLQVTINDDPESRRHLKQFSNPKKFVLQSRTHSKPALIAGSSFKVNLDRTVGLTALKMAFASATLVFPDEIANFKDARLDLAEVEQCSAPMRSLVIDNRTHKLLDAARPALCHAIYIEEHDGIIHGVVQFFGAFQCYIKLSDIVSRSYDSGLLATLDPTTGAEVFRELPRLGISKWTGKEMADQLAPIKKFNRDAMERGAKSVALDVSGVAGEDGIEQTVRASLFGWSWTGDMVGRRK
jgi:hypothetical protein